MTPQPLTGRMAHSLQIAWVAELTLFTLVGAFLHRKGFSCSVIAAVLVAWWFGWRALVVADGFRNSERHKSRRTLQQQVGFFGALRLFLAEYVYTVLSFGFMFPLERWLLPLAPQPAVAGRKTPVILVHGFVCNRGYWKFFLRALERAGLGPVYVVTLEPVLGSIDENARRLGEIIEQICKVTGAPQVALVGHSMGGLIIRAYLHSGGASRVERAITLGSPHHGTYSAHLVRRLAVNAEQMCRNNAWNAALNAHEAKPCPVPITSMWTPHDNIAFPQDSAVLRYPNARNIDFPGLGHVELVYSQKVITRVIEELRS